MHNVISLGLLLLVGGTIFAQTTPTLPEPLYEKREDHDPNGIGKFFLDREIAHVMGHQGASWLERPEREKEESPTKLHELLDLKPGMIAADIGAGSGYHSFRMSQAVGEKGRVYAVDIQQEMLDIMSRRMKQRKVDNIELVLGTTKNPKLPEAGVDLMLMVDVYHEFDFPYEMTKEMVKALKPGGRLVFVEYRLEDAKVPIKLVHKMSERQVLKEMSLFPEMKHAKTFKELPWQHVIVFEKQAKE